MDPTDEGVLKWENFINFAIEEHSKRIQMRETYDEMPFGPLGIHVKQNHQDIFVRIIFMPNVDPVTKVVNWGQGKYMMISRDGILSVWNNRLVNQGYYVMGGKGSILNSWTTDMVAMYHNGMVVCATTNRDVCFYDFNTEGWSKKYAIVRLESSVTKLSYWSDETKDMKAVLLWGDTSGNVTMLEFDLSQRVPMFGKRLREHCIEMLFSDIQKGYFEGVTFRTYKNIHKDWVREVMYVPKMTSILSCSMDSSTALYLTPVDPTKKQPKYFATYKGILCFDFSAGTNTIASAGMDCNIWLFNIYVPQKCIAMLEGHNRPISHIKINEKENFVISLDLDNNLRISNLITQRVIMTIPNQSLKSGRYGVSTMCLNPFRNVCLLGSSRLTMLKPNQIEGLIVDIRSHDHPLIGALYNPFFEQVISVCRGSMVRIWDVNTGTRVMQFGMAHSKKEHGRTMPVEIETVALTDNKKRLFTAAEGVVKLWNFSCGALLRVFDLKECERICSIVMAKSRIYITGWNKVITVYSDFKGEEALTKEWQKRHNEDVLSLCVLEPNMIASSSYDGSIIIWSRETQEPYCKLCASFSNKPELLGTKGGTEISTVADLNAESDDEEEQGEDAFMTIGKHLRKEGGWYRLLRALKKRQIAREKRRAAKERRDINAKFKRKKKRLNMQALSLVYESAVECLVYLESRRAIEPHTATLVAGGSECWIRFWSLHPNGGLLAQWNCTRRKQETVRAMTSDKNNEYLFTGDTIGLLRIWDIKEFANSEKLSPETRSAREAKLRKDFCYTRLPFKAEEIQDTMEKLRAMGISVPDASKPRKNLKSPRLLSSIRAHTQAIMSVEFLEDRNVIITSSQDRTVRLWTKNCTYIGTFGGDGWKPLPPVLGPIVERRPKIPRDVLRVASARSLATMHNTKMPHWQTACHLVKRHIVELQREKNIEATRQKMKEDKRARGEPDSDEEVVTGEKPESKILGKQYRSKLKCKGNKNVDAYGYAPLMIFRTTCAPYHSICPRDVGYMDPLYPASTFQDIDSRRTKNKSKRSLKQMMNQFSTIIGEGAGKGSQKLSESWMSETTEGADRSKSSDRDTNLNKSPSPSTIIYDRNQSSPDGLPDIHSETSSTTSQRLLNRRTRYSEVKSERRSLTWSSERQHNASPLPAISTIRNVNSPPNMSTKGAKAHIPYESKSIEHSTSEHAIKQNRMYNSGALWNDENILKRPPYDRPKFFQRKYDPTIRTTFKSKTIDARRGSVDQRAEIPEQQYAAMKTKFSKEKRHDRFKPRRHKANPFGEPSQTENSQSRKSQESKFLPKLPEDDEGSVFSTRPKFFTETAEMLAAARECIRADIQCNLEDSLCFDEDLDSDENEDDLESDEKPDVSFDGADVDACNFNLNGNLKNKKALSHSNDITRLPPIKK